MARATASRVWPTVSISIPNLNSRIVRSVAVVDREQSKRRSCSSESRTPRDDEVDSGVVTQNSPSEMASNIAFRNCHKVSRSHGTDEKRRFTPAEGNNGSLDIQTHSASLRAQVL